MDRCLHVYVRKQALWFDTDSQKNMMCENLGLKTTAAMKKKSRKVRPHEKKRSAKLLSRIISYFRSALPSVLHTT